MSHQLAIPYFCVRTRFWAGDLARNKAMYLNCVSHDLMCPARTQPGNQKISLEFLKSAGSLRGLAIPLELSALRHVDGLATKAAIVDVVLPELILQYVQHRSASPHAREQFFNLVFNALEDRLRYPDVGEVPVKINREVLKILNKPTVYKGMEVVKGELQTCPLQIVDSDPHPAPHPAMQMKSISELDIQQKIETLQMPQLRKNPEGVWIEEVPNQGFLQNIKDLYPETGSKEGKPGEPYDPRQHLPPGLASKCKVVDMTQSVAEECPVKKSLWNVLHPDRGPRDMGEAPLDCFEGFEEDTLV